MMLDYDRIDKLHDDISVADITILDYAGKYRPRHGPEIHWGWTIPIEPQYYAENLWKPNEERRLKCDGLVVGMDVNCKSVILAPRGNDVHFIELHHSDVASLINILQLHYEYLIQK
jgi:hypothetical protein